MSRNAVGVGVRLTSIVPTPAELREAEELIARAKDPAKKLASCMQTFKSWCQTTGRSQNVQLLDSRTEERRQYMFQYLVMVQRHKKQKLQVTTTDAKIAERRELGECGWRGWAFVIGEYGEEKTPSTETI